MTGWDGSTRAERLPADWPERRRLVFERDGNTCHVCGRSGADEIDHVNQGDDHALENLRPIHGSRTGLRCHSAKSGREGGRATAAKKASTRRPEEPHPGLRD
jgi:5-methylcytosine-specific restriction endonuclease McrA